MFNILICCTHDYSNDSSTEDKEEIIFEFDKEKSPQGKSKSETFQNSIGELKKAEIEALKILEKAKKNKKEYLLQAESAAVEIVKPYYELAKQEYKEIEDSLNKELHIKSLENVLEKQENPDDIEGIDLDERKKQTIEYIYSKISDVKLILENPKYVKSQLEKHKVSKVHQKRHSIRSRLLSWASKDYTEKEKESKKIQKQNKKEKTISFSVEEKNSSMSTIELDEDYSRINNLYGASRVVNSFNTIHLN
ncbi:Vacuolar (H+)-ATPase G subunit family protein [Cryptosporidium meleagridis]|uniref:Vacuolar (H+)-ATPase G subunit family protein n=1 Tax=Cryptosporidium meleagridis TaxID=93969 RepID=A0A2P4Z4K2_9CRYT|nr:Vacuolar (H+)-ATPase G subunit family protein [Cryptosporidium meleagridis]